MNSSYRLSISTKTLILVKMEMMKSIFWISKFSKEVWGNIFQVFKGYHRYIWCFSTPLWQFLKGNSNDKTGYCLKLSKLSCDKFLCEFKASYLIFKFKTSVDCPILHKTQPFIVNSTLNCKWISIDSPFIKFSVVLLSFNVVVCLISEIALKIFF